MRVTEYFSSGLDPMRLIVRPALRSISGCEVAVLTAWLGTAASVRIFTGGPTPLARFGSGSCEAGRAPRFLSGCSSEGPVSARGERKRRGRTRSFIVQLSLDREMSYCPGLSLATDK